MFTIVGNATRNPHIRHKVQQNFEKKNHQIQQKFGEKIGKTFFQPIFLADSG